MTAPTGPLVWGQPNAYNAQDDRSAITALANNTVGLVKAPTFAASGGLTMAIGSFIAIVSCGDGTSIVASSTITQTVTLAAGPGTGSRTDIIWLDIEPDTTGLWTINVVTQAATVGRLGIKLGQVVMPQGANTAAAGTMTPSAKSYVPFPQPAARVHASIVRDASFQIPTNQNVNIGSQSGWLAEELGGASALWNSTGFICPAAGIYLTSGRAYWPVNNDGFRSGIILKNGAYLMLSETRIPAGGTGTYCSTIVPAYPVKCIAGDVLSLNVFQNSGITLTLVRAQFSVSQQS
jgi:hypothetical protein